MIRAVQIVKVAEDINSATEDLGQPGSKYKSSTRERVLAFVYITSGVEPEAKKSLEAQFSQHDVPVILLQQETPVEVSYHGWPEPDDDDDEDGE